MGEYYLDIETTGINEVDSKIITIQYAPITHDTREMGDVTILKEWELGEKGILDKFVKDTPITERVFDFVPIGYNLLFENKFFLSKFNKYNIPQIDILLRPHIDLKSLGVMMNKGEFRNSGLDKLTRKPSSGTQIPDWYKQKVYDEIENYINMEAKEFGRWFKWLSERLPQLQQEWIQQI